METKESLLSDIKRLVESDFPGCEVTGGRWDGMVVVLNVPPSVAASVKSTIRSFRDRANLIGLDLLPILKDPKTTKEYYK